MDTHRFAGELLQGLSALDSFDRITLQNEGPIINGRAFATGNPSLFLRFYYNSTTGTLAFALIEDKQRIWGIDYDNRRGWHLHPVTNPAAHEPISALSITEIITALRHVVEPQSATRQE